MSQSGSTQPGMVANLWGAFARAVTAIVRVIGIAWNVALGGVTLLLLGSLVWGLATSKIDPSSKPKPTPPAMSTAAQALAARQQQRVMAQNRIFLQIFDLETKCKVSARQLERSLERPFFREQLMACDWASQIAVQKAELLMVDYLAFADDVLSEHRQSQADAYDDYRVPGR